MQTESLIPKIKEILSLKLSAEDILERLHELVEPIWEKDNYDLFSERECEIIHIIIYDWGPLSAKKVLKKIREILTIS